MIYAEEKITIDIVTHIDPVKPDPVKPVKLTWLQRFFKWIDKILGL